MIYLDTHVLVRLYLGDIGGLSDPFDRLIVANAKARNAPLVTKDERIRRHYSSAVW